MKKIVHKAEERGVGDHNWLTSRFSFSFADWYEPSRMGFGTLRVLNDDIIEPQNGFPPHSHRDMEIITIVTRGAVVHKDSLGNDYTIPAGDVQVMSAGTGVTHAELNDEDEPLELFQLWIIPLAKGLPSRYEQKSFPDAKEQLLVSPDGRDGSLTIQQNAYITKVRVQKGEVYTYTLPEPGNCIYVFVIEGEATAAGENVMSRDAVGVWDADNVLIEATAETHVLLIEVPMR